MTKLVGNTYPVKDQIRALGGRWDAAEKAWYVPDARADEAAALIASAPISAPATPGRCRDCGATCKAPYTSCWTCKQKRDRRSGSAKCAVCGRVPSGQYGDHLYRSGECRDCFEERKMGY